jgi:NADH:ubiquinone oxidoreductase subunit F (NADH-binding)/NADH:ubiquinone oxidoreductase subunit E
MDDAFSSDAPEESAVGLTGFFGTEQARLSETIAPETWAGIDDYLERNPGGQERLIPLLHLVQETLGYLPFAVQEYIAGKLGLSPIQVHGVVSFYSRYDHREPPQDSAPRARSTSGLQESLAGERALSRVDLATIRERLRARIDARRHARRAHTCEPREVLVCAGGGCAAARSLDLAVTLEEEIEAAGLVGRASVVRVGCIGLCSAGPLVQVSPDGVFYRNVDEEHAGRIVREHLAADCPVTDLELTWKDDVGGGLRSRDIPFFARQHRIALRNCGVIDPLDVDEYIASDGYLALEKTLFGLTREEVLRTLHRAGLRGRAGAGFAAGLKWQVVKEAAGDEKFIVCNADDGDPRAFLDRSLIEGDPYSVIEAMTIAGWVVGSRQGYVYVRAEYPLAIERLERALYQVRARGLLGKGILGSGHEFDIEIKIGPGAFVCGEETALLHSIEGRRGTPRPRPPFPAQEGLWGKPTLLSNVETWVNVPVIIHRGADWFAALGTPGNRGTKVFTLSGSVWNTGLVEVPLGVTLREVVEVIGGGMRSGRAFKAVQCGGPSGGCIPATRADMPLEYESLQQAGAMMGSGGLVVLDEGTCVVELARHYLQFLAEESCGKCPPCRIGIRVLLKILERITQGSGRAEDLEILASLGQHVQRTSLCGLGQTAPNTVLSTLRYFRDEVEAHIFEHRCPAARCPALLKRDAGVTPR